MIVGSLYPTYETTVVGTPTADKEVYTTASWGGGQVTSMESYWLGWINYENLPACFHRAAAYIEDGTGDLVVKDMTVQGNFPCGYIWNNYSNTHLQVEDIYISNPPYYKTGYCWLFNENYPEYSGLVYDSNYSNRAEIGACIFISDMGGNIVYPYSKSDNENYIVLFDSDGSTYIDDLYKFLFLGAHYTATKLIVVNGLSLTLSFDITADMLESGTGYIQDSSGMYNMRFYVVGSYFGKGCALKNNSTTSLTASFTVKLSESYGGESSDIIRTGHYCSEYSNRIWFYRYGTPTESNPAIGLGIKGDARISAASLAAVVNGGVGAHATDGNVFIHVNDNRLYVSAITTLDDIKKSLSLYYRVCRENLPSYVIGKTYATDVTPDNEFLARLKTGDIEDTTFKSSLRPWQYSKFTDDEFTEEDIPSPEPEPGGDDPGSDEPVETPLVTGDDQLLQLDRTLATPTDFITMYNITPPMLSIFGRTLWKSLLDYDYTDPSTLEVFMNFFTVLSDEVTGTLDIGAILQFVVSVRQYPFNVAGLGITQSVGNSIKIGTGKFPIELGSAANVQKLSSTIGLLDCGTVTIADYGDFKLYNDFRDYLNSSVSAFLPYCGTVELNPVEVIHNTLHCYYAIDFYTGECTAYITCSDGNREWISAVKNGVIGVLIPLTATNSGQISARHTTDNAKDSALLWSNLGNLTGAVANIATGNLAGLGSNIQGLMMNGVNQQMLQAERQGRSAVMAPSLSGGSGAAAFYQPSCASILVRRGTYARDKIANYPSTCAYPTTTSGTISSFHGYTECYNVDVDKLNCNEEERAQVKMILETGVYLP